MFPRSENGVKDVEKQQRAGSAFEKKHGGAHRMCLRLNMCDAFKGPGANLEPI